MVNSYLKKKVPVNWSAKDCVSIYCITF